MKTNETISIADKIVDFIKRNRVSTTEVADCLGKSGAISGISALNRGHFRVGLVKWVCAYNNSNWPVHEAIASSCCENQIIFIDAYNCKDRSIIGQLVSKYILLYLQAAAIVVDAPMRDAAELMRENYPIWCRGVNPIGCFNTKPKDLLPDDVKRARKSLYEGAIMVCDDCGVVLIPKTMQTPDFLDKLIAIEAQEDTWFHRLDFEKDSTFDIVCLKTYLNRQSTSTQHVN